MAKLVVPTILSSYLSTTELNSVLQDIATALENTLSRDGTSPNMMTANIDMNSNKIINLPAAVLDGDVPNYGQVKSLGSGYVTQKIERQVATAAQTVVTLTNMNYTVGSNNLSVYKNGLRIFAGYGYTETSSTVVTFDPLTNGDVLEFVSNEYLATVNITAPTSVAWSTLTGIPSYGTRWPTWTEVTSKPTTFTPASHVHATTDITSGVSLPDVYRGVYVQVGTPTASRIGDLWFY